MPTSLLVPGHQHAHTHTIILAWQVKALMDPLNRHQEPIRNSGHMGGRFSEKRRIKNPATGEYFKLSEPWLHSRLMMFPGLQSLNESLALLQNSISRGMVYTPHLGDGNRPLRVCYQPIQWCSGLVCGADRGDRGAATPHHPC